MGADWLGGRWWLLLVTADRVAETHKDSLEAAPGQARRAGPAPPSLGRLPPLQTSLLQDRPEGQEHLHSIQNRWDLKLVETHLWAQRGTGLS